MVYGDHDVRKGMVTFDAFLKLLDSNRNDYGAIFQLGDIAYDLFTENGLVGEDYMQKAQKFAATIPFMAVAGNHEAYLNYTYFNLRFKMPLYDQY